MSERTFIFQRDGGGQEETIKISITETVSVLLNKYLNGKSTTQTIKDFAFMIGANALKSKKFINSQIKNVPCLRPNAIIKVREVDTKAGGTI
jgi:hypothetical protein